MSAPSNSGNRRFLFPAQAQNKTESEIQIVQPMNAGSKMKRKADEKCNTLIHFPICSDNGTGEMLESLTGAPDLNRAKSNGWP